MKRSFFIAAFAAIILAVNTLAIGPVWAGSAPQGNTIHINNRMSSDVEVIFRDGAGKEVHRMNIRGHAIASGTMLGTFTLTGSFVENGRTVQIKPRTVDLTKNGAIVTAIDYDYKGGGGYAFT